MTQNGEKRDNYNSPREGTYELSGTASKIILAFIDGLFKEHHGVAPSYVDVIVEILEWSAITNYQEAQRWIAVWNGANPTQQIAIPDNIPVRFDYVTDDGIDWHFQPVYE